MQYIGQRGYTIYKKDLTEKDIKQIKTDLIVKPFVPKSASNYGGAGDSLKFIVYRESTSRFYLPRHYGMDTFGNSGTYQNMLPQGIHTPHMTFTGTLRPYQDAICDKFISYISPSPSPSPSSSNLENNGNNNETPFLTGGGCLEIDTGMGKTVMAINIMSRIQRKTLIVVHKEFLVNQWIERIQEFMPQVSIGKIQGKTVDIDGHDVVIAMLQSLSMKTYDISLFKSFGFMIIDEVHHMGAEVFSKALTKVVTNCTLGLSATMNRKDGLTKVFKMFIGPTIHVEKRDHSSNRVLVKAVPYVVDDDDFNETEIDYRGQVQYSKMITKLCNYNRRGEFMLQFLESFIEDDAKHNKQQQIMLLGHNKSLLKFMFEGIKGRNIANGDVGYYVGGMKEKDLKISESKKIVIATYSMASEGLDIKTLTTLMMLTPKTDIVQAVGRILRSKHEHCQPMVIDIIDNQDVFQRQYKTRLKFYNQQNYKVINWLHDHPKACRADGKYCFIQNKHDQDNGDGNGDGNGHDDGDDDDELWQTHFDYNAEGKYENILKQKHRKSRVKNGNNKGKGTSAYRGKSKTDHVQDHDDEDLIQHTCLIDGL